MLSGKGKILIHIFSPIRQINFLKLQTNHYTTMIKALITYFCHPFRKKKEWDVYEPIVDLLSNEEVDALEAKEERMTK